MTQIVGLRGLSEFVSRKGNGLVARNSGTAEFSQAAAHLTQGMLPWIPRPIERGQRDGHDAGREELEQQMRHTQEQGPAPDALPRAALIVAQPQLFDFVEVDLNLKAAGIGVDGLYGIKGEVGTQQVP